MMTFDYLVINIFCYRETLGILIFFNCGILKTNLHDSTLITEVRRSDLVLNILLNICLKY